MAESMKGLRRTHRCGELSRANIGETVTIMGWVQKNRNKGGLVFVDVRDRSGLIQVVFEEGSTEKELLEKINGLGIGPAGLGGRVTALAVNVETYPTHIAGLPVAVNICCHVNRHVRRSI